MGAATPPSKGGEYASSPPLLQQSNKHTTSTTIKTDAWDYCSGRRSRAEEKPVASRFSAISAKSIRSTFSSSEGSSRHFRKRRTSGRFLGDSTESIVPGEPPARRTASLNSGENGNIARSSLRGTGVGTISARSSETRMKRSSTLHSGQALGVWTALDLARSTYCSFRAFKPSSTL